MRKIFVMLLLFFVAVFLTGCGGTNTSGGKAFIGGTEGIKASFLPGNPPTAIYDNGQSGFSIVVKLENAGEDTLAINDGYVKINGLDIGTYGLDDSIVNFPTAELKGAVKNFDGSVLNGGITTAEFSGLSYDQAIQGNIVQTIWADICYTYSTKATTQLCIKRDPQMLLNNNKICDVEGEKGPQNSGAPIQVTSLKESFAGTGRIGVTLIITHMGTGDAFFSPEVTECNDVESNSDRGRVLVTVLPVSIGNRDITPQCSGFSGATTSTNRGYIRMYKDGSGKEQYSLYCTLDASTADSIFQVPIDVEITYKYLEHLQTDMTIRHVAQ